MYLTIVVISVTLLIVVYKVCHNLEMKLNIEALKTYQDLKTSNLIQKETLDVYRSLDEGIMSI